MKKKVFYPFFLASAIALSGVALSGCGNNPKTSSSSTTPSSSVSSSSVDYGTVSIRDLEIAFQQEVIITPVFSKPEYEEDLTYSFEGNAISINQGKIKGLVPGETVTVTASSEHFNTTFDVDVTYLSGTLQNETGAESKYAVSLPEASIKNYVLHFDVLCETINENWTRLSSFAFNASDNSWYNIETSGNNVLLFARFNGVEKYFIFLDTKDNLRNKDNKIEYSVDIVKKGQKTLFYFNDKFITGFDEEDMAGYADLASFEVTAASDRDPVGAYKIQLNNIFWELEDSASYKALINPVLEFEDATLENQAGDESKYSYGDVASIYKNFLYTTTVDVPTWDESNFRPTAFAFNGSDNSWYNIEMNASGDLTLYGRFNGHEKYHIALGNKSSLMVDNAIHYTIGILKMGEATYFYFNNEIKCAFSAADMVGYAKLSSLEVTACAKVWDEGAPYKVVLSGTSIVGEEDAAYKAAVSAFYKKFDNTEMVSDADGHETKTNYGYVTEKCVFSVDVAINQYPTNWFRPIALAFNGSDNSWFNFETNSSKDLTLYARFNGVEKYGIACGNLADYEAAGTPVLELTVLKEGQNVYLFIGETLKASFVGTEVAGLYGLTNLEATACADRDGGQFKVGLKGAELEDGNSDTYKTFHDLIANA